MEKTKSGKRREVPLNARAGCGSYSRRGPQATWLRVGANRFNHFRVRLGGCCRAGQARGLPLPRPAAHLRKLVRTGAERACRRSKTYSASATLAMTLRYAHLAPERLRAAVSRLDDVMPQTAPVHPLPGASRAQEPSKLP